MDYLLRQGRFHRMIPLPHRQGFVQCTRCTEDMSTMTIETAIRACQEDMSLRLTHGDTEITGMIERFLDRSVPPILSIRDLVSFMEERESVQRCFNPYNDLPVIVFIEDAIFDAIGFNPQRLQFAELDDMGHGYHVGFISQHASNGFFSQLNNIRHCESIIRDRLERGTYWDYSTFVIERPESRQ